MLTRHSLSAASSRLDYKNTKDEVHDRLPRCIVASQLFTGGGRPPLALCAFLLRPLAGSAQDAAQPRSLHCRGCRWYVPSFLIAECGRSPFGHGLTAGSTLPANSPFSTPAYNQAVPDLPAFCRFGAYIHTSNMSKVQFEVWLPDVWSGRYAMVGNGGQSSFTGCLKPTIRFGPIAHITFTQAMLAESTSPTCGRL